MHYQRRYEHFSVPKEHCYVEEPQFYEQPSIFEIKEISY